MTLGINVHVRVSIAEDVFKVRSERSKLRPDQLSYNRRSKRFDHRGSTGPAEHLLRTTPAQYGGR